MALRLFFKPFQCRPTAAEEQDPPSGRSKHMHANEGVDGGVRGWGVGRVSVRLLIRVFVFHGEKEEEEEEESEGKR